MKKFSFITFLILLLPSVCYAEVDLLVLAKDISPTRTKGMIIEVRQCPHKGWGLDEKPPTYFIVKVTDKDEKDIKLYHKLHYEVDDKALKSRYAIDFTGLGIDTTITKEKSFTWKELDPNKIKDKSLE